MKEIISRYSLSIATAKRILKEASISENELKIFYSKSWYKILKWDAVKSSVASFIENTKYPVYWKDIARHLDVEYKMEIGTKYIHKFLKNSLNLSFKRGWSRMINYDFVKIKLQKGIFAWRLCKMIPKANLIINIDEASVSKNSKTHYAWLAKGQSGLIKNERIQGSLSFISAVATNGCAFNYVTKGTVNSSKFIKFLDHLKTHVIQWMKTNTNKALLMLDNWSTHQS